MLCRRIFTSLPFSSMVVSELCEHEGFIVRVQFDIG